jgi:hypothetical protein
MRFSLEKLYEMAEEALARHEADIDEDQKAASYHEGWADALRWLLDILEPEIYDKRREVDNEEW